MTACSNRTRQRIAELVGDNTETSRTAAEAAAFANVADAACNVIDDIEAGGGHTPGIYIDEHGQLEARWIVTHRDTNETHVINATFDTEHIDIYVYDRTSEQIVKETRTSYHTARTTITDIIDPATTRTPNNRDGDGYQPDQTIDPTGPA